MAKKGGSNRLKRSRAPRQWDIERKEKRFIIKPSPGPYSIENELSARGSAARDILKLVNDKRELRYVLTNGEC